MGKTLYLDCANGISGDMFVAALLDLGANEARLRDTLATLGVDGFEARVSRVSKAGIDCCDFDVRLDADHENHDHDMAYLHGHEPVPERHHEHGHEHRHEHRHEHEHEHEHHHRHRGPADIKRIIDTGRLAPCARDLAHRMVDIIAAAEAKAHALPVDQVHFHEVGAIDSIVDIISAAVAVDDLDIDRVIVPRLVDGYGSIRCQHGVIPVPVPATLNIAVAHGLPLSQGDVEGELVTPTGAAIVAALDAEQELPGRYRVRRVGYGAGKRAYSRPSILRALIIEEIPERAHGTAPNEGAPTIDAALPGPIVRLECDIDDATGEQLAYAADRLRAAGAREVHWVPLYGKKGRPAWQLQVVAAPADVVRLEEAIFAETTTIGIRRWSCERTALPRHEETVETPWGAVRMKVVSLPDGTRRAAPEFEDAAAIARANGVALQTVMRTAQAAWRA